MNKPEDALDLCVQGLPMFIKAVVVAFIILPRLFVTLALLWMGCRWLEASVSFSDIVLNCCALGFLLSTKDLMFRAVMPQRNVSDVCRTKIVCVHVLPATYASFLGAFLWLVLSVAWVLVYTYHAQMVLVDYKWDVREVCAHYLSEVLPSRV